MIEYLTLGCLVITLAFLSLALHWLSSAAGFMDIAAKLRRGEALTPKEQKKLDKAKAAL